MMSKYRVELERALTEFMFVEVEAESEEEAMRLAQEDPYKYPEEEGDIEGEDYIALNAILVEELE